MCLQSVKKGGFGRQHTMFTSCQNAACSMNCFLWLVQINMLWMKTFWLSKCEFLLLILYWQIMTHILIFYLFWNVKLFILWLRLRVIGCLISSKCLLDLNNSKPFSFCPWMWLFTAMFCHAGPSSLAFLAGWL